jgi:cytochrome oxidase assembly protein ShyY1
MTTRFTRSDWARIAAATLLALLALVVVGALGLWQFDRAYRDDIREQVLGAPAQPVQSLVSPGSYLPEFDFAHAVTVAGRVQPEQALLSCRENDQCLLLAPVQVTPQHYVAVVFESVARDASASALAEFRTGSARDVTLQGRLQPSEAIIRPNALLQRADDIPLVTTNELVLRWGLPLLEGYVVSDGLNVELNLPPSGISWRNLGYAWQWWSFAAFIVFLLGRYVLDVRNDRARAMRRS